MTAKAIVEELEKILKVHPEAVEARVWSGGKPVLSIGYDRRHKPARIKLNTE